MVTSLLFLTCSCLYYIANSADDCTWEASFPGGTTTLDFSCVKTQTITLHDETTHTYTFSLCRNALTCPGDDSTPHMVSQVDDNDNSLCYIIGYWDANIDPNYNSDNDGTYRFSYDGKDDCGQPNRLWQPTFICDPSVNGFEGSTVPDDGGSCIYTVDIRTKYACEGGCDGGGPSGGGSTSDDGLSGGWLFIICLGGAFFLYCVGGYLFMGLSVNKDKGLGAFNDNIPNKGFWVTCPKLVMTGCQVTVEFLKGLTNKGGSSDGDDGALDEPITNE